MVRLAKIAHNPFFWLGLALLLAAGMKAWLVFGGWVPFNADEAVVALMARHILAGARPTFFYGQAYMGSLDAFLVAGAFALGGEQVWLIRLLQTLLYLGFLLTTASLGRAVFGRWAVGALGALLLALPPVNLTLYTTISLGGYGEALLIGNLILLAALHIAHGWERGDLPGKAWHWAWLGLLIGGGLWAFGLTLVYAIPALVFLTWRFFWGAPRTRKIFPLARLLSFALGLLLGSLPWWLYALRNGMSGLLGELGGGAIAGVEGLSWPARIMQHALNLALFGLTAALGFRPPWDLTWLALPLLPFALAFWLGVLIYLVCSPRSGQSDAQAGTQPEAEKWLLAGVVLTLLLAFLLTPFGADPSGRYFVPLAAPLALFAADLIFKLRERYGNWAFALAGLLILFQLWGNLQSALKFPPGITSQFYAPTQLDHRHDAALIDFLSEEGETRGYTNYWTAYPLAFLSQERLIFVPRLPYHLDFRYTARDDRYPAYTAQVETAARVAYITTHHPELDQYLRVQFAALGITWQEAQIGDYRVFYRLNQPVRPTQIGLGETTSP